MDRNRFLLENIDPIKRELIQQIVESITGLFVFQDRGIRERLNGFFKKVLYIEDTFLTVIRANHILTEPCEIAGGRIAEREIAKVFQVAFVASHFLHGLQVGGVGGLFFGRCGETANLHEKNSGKDERKQFFHWNAPFLYVFLWMVSDCC